MSLTDLISLLQAHNWLGLIVLVVLIARKWTGPDSKFPVTIPPTWQPTVTAAGGLVYGLVSALQQGQSAGAAILSMAIAAGTGGFLDGILMAVFNHDNAPVWARSIVFIFDDLTGGGTPPTGAAKERIARLSSKPPPPVATRGRVGFGRMSESVVVVPVLFGATIFLMFATWGTAGRLHVSQGAIVAGGGCTPAQQAELSDLEKTILADIAAGKSRQQIEADVATILVGKDGPAIARIVDDVIQLLLDRGYIQTDAAQKLLTHPIGCAK